MPYPWVQAAADLPPPDHAPRRWVRVSRTRPCPVCAKPDWCSVTDDGTAAMCMRVGDGAARHVDLGHGTGHLHERNGHAGPAAISSTSTASYAAPVEHRFQLDYDAILARWRAVTPAAAIDAFAGELSVTRASLERLDAVYCPERRAWAFPMHDDKRRIIGFRLRSPDGRKFALDGSRSGIFIPSQLDTRSQLLICEGPTDTAAALSLGFHAVGRPSASGGTGYLCDMIAVGRRREIAVVADADGPGRYGAHRLADQLDGLSGGVKVLSLSPAKDLRAWLRAAGTPQALALRIHSANWHRKKNGLDQAGKADAKKG